MFASFSQSSGKKAHEKRRPSGEEEEEDDERKWGSVHVWWAVFTVSEEGGANYWEL